MGLRYPNSFEHAFPSVVFNKKAEGKALYCFTELNVISHPEHRHREGSALPSNAVGREESPCRGACGVFEHEDKLCDGTVTGFIACMSTEKISGLTITRLVSPRLWFLMTSAPTGQWVWSQGSESSHAFREVRRAWRASPVPHRRHTLFAEVLAHLSQLVHRNSLNDDACVPLSPAAP